MNSSCKRVEPFAPQRGSLGKHVIAAPRCDLSIDPGKNTGWALFGDTLLACGAGKPPFESANRVAIELPQNYPNNPVPPQDLIMLAFLAGRYAGAAGDAEVVTFFPHAWKGNLPKNVCEARVRARLTPEERKIVDECGVPKGQMNNVWDAIGIGLFAFQSIKP